MLLKTSLRIGALVFLQVVAIAQPGYAQSLQGHVPAAAARLTPVGRVEPARELKLAISLPLRNKEALATLLQRLYDPASPDYHRYLTPDQFTASFGPTVQDYQRVNDFAKSNRLAVTATHESRLVLDVRGNVSDIERAFHVKLRTYQHPAEPRQFYAPDVEPSVEAGVPILDIAGLSDYALPRPALHAKPAGAGAVPAAGSAPGGNYMGQDFRNAYVPGVSLNGAGQMVGLVEFDGYYAADIAAYEALAGLPNVPLINVPIDGFSGSPGAGNQEVSLDIEMTISMAPGLAAVVVFESPNNTANWVDILDRMAQSNQIKQFSASWGYSGPGPYTSLDNRFQQLAAQGQSFFQSSGDGDAYVNPSYSIWVPADSPYVTSVGGTTLTMSGSGAAYGSERVWNWGLDPPGWPLFTNGYWGSAGGVSTNYGIPSWQQGMSMAANGGSDTLRNVPDVALTADNIWLICSNGQSVSFGGSSAAAPLWAGFTALVNEQATNNHLSSVGFLNPALYSMAQSAFYSSCFHDITAGDNTWSNSLTQFFAVPGYDLATGLGSPKGQALINYLAGDALAQTPSYANLALLAGTSVTLTAFAADPTTSSYQWKTDGGSGGALTNIPGATSATLSVNTTGWTPGAYNYQFVTGNSFGGCASSVVPITITNVFMVDLGGSDPAPGPADISQFLNTSQNGDGINYFTDNGPKYDEWPGQTFTMGANPNGYVMNSLAFKTAGFGNSFPTVQLYHLRIFSVSANGATASLVAGYTGYGGGNENDWFKWVGINVPLAPNARYAYTLGRDGTAIGLERLANQGGNPYAGGQICDIPAGGGTITYGITGNSDATFDAGLIAVATPVLSWATPATISYGTALSSSQLNATADVPGSFAYTPPIGTALNAGTHTLSVVFTPTDTVYYSSATNTVSLVVSPVPLTITSGLTANNKVYDRATAATLSFNSVVLSGVVPGDTISLNGGGYSADFASAGVGNDIAVTVSGLTLSGAAAGNYTLTQPSPLAANITPAGVTIGSGITANNKVYDRATAATLSFNSVVLSGVIPGDSISLNGGGYSANFASAGVGNGIAVIVSGLTLSGAAAGNYSLTQPAALAANITPVGVTIASGITANNKVYDRATAATLGFNSVVLSGVLPGDTISLNDGGYSANFASAGVGNGIAVTVSGLVLSGAAAGNYTLTQPAALTANITPAGVTIASGITANNKVYDRATAATLGFNNVVLSGVLPGDTVSLNSAGYSANFASAGVGNGIAVTVSGLTLSGAAAANYSLTQPAALTANITPVGVTVASGVTANNKVYDRTTAATLGFNSVVLSGVLPGDSISLNGGGYSANFASAGVGNGIAVTVSGLTLSGAAAGNYSLTQPAALTANITPVGVTVASGVTANNKVYDRTAAATLSFNSVVLSGVLPGDSVSLNGGGYSANFASAGVGNGIAVTVSGLTLSGAAAANYSLTQPAALTANITPVGVTITSGITVNNKVYDRTTGATLGFNSVALSGVLPGDTVSLNSAGYSANFASAGVGNGIAVTVSGLTLSGAAAGNYTLTQPSPLAANITPAGVTIGSGITANNKVYDRATAATLSFNSVVLSGVLPGDTVSLNTGGCSACFTSAGVGNGIAVTVSGLTLSGASAGNYTLAQPSPLAANITQAGVTITSGMTANNKVYDRATAATLSFNSVVLSGVIPGDTVSLNAVGCSACFTSAGVGNGIAVAVSGLTLSGAAAGNYALTQPASLTANITPAGISIASGITANNKVYDRATAATLSFNSIVLSGVIPGDAVSLNTAGYSANFASTGVGNGIAVAVSGLTLSGAAGGNYTLTQPSPLAANITPAGVTIASGITANNKVYDRATPATLSFNSVVLSGVIPGDTVSLNAVGCSACFTNPGVGNGIAVTVSGLTLSGAAAGNYTLTQPSPLAANITPAGVTIASGITANNKVYDRATAATLSFNSVVLSGVIPGDTVTLNTNSYVANFASANVGNGIAVIVSGLTLSGASAGNYRLTQPAALTANITSPSLRITASLPNIVIAWTTNATDFVLNQTAGLIPPVQWSPVTNAITVNGTNRAVIINAGSGAKYFCLIAAP